MMFLLITHLSIAPHPVLTRFTSPSPKTPHPTRFTPSPFFHGSQSQETDRKWIGFGFGLSRTVLVSTFFGFSKVTVSVSVFGRSVSVLVSTFFGFSKVSVSVFFRLFSVLVSVFLHQIFYKNGRFVQNLNKYYGLKQFLLFFKEIR